MSAWCSTCHDVPRWYVTDPNDGPEQGLGEPLRQGGRIPPRPRPKDLQPVPGSPDWVPSDASEVETSDLSEGDL